MTVRREEPYLPVVEYDEEEVKRHDSLAV